jgi:hypothetical protein
MIPRDPESRKDAVPDLGSPTFNEYTRLLLAADDARKALHAAQIAGDRDAISRAELEREEAIGDVYAFKARVAADLLLAIRFVEEIHPGRVAAITGHSEPSELDVTQTAIVAAEGRIEELENAVVALEADRGRRECP